MNTNFCFFTEVLFDFLAELKAHYPEVTSEFAGNRKWDGTVDYQSTSGEKKSFDKRI